jgi:hypothetical protein
MAEDLLQIAKVIPFAGVAAFRDGRPLFFGVSATLLTEAAAFGLAAAAAVVLVLAARAGRAGKDSLLGREVAAVSETGLRVRLGDGPVASLFATADVRFLAGMVRRLSVLQCA